MNPTSSSPRPSPSRLVRDPRVPRKRSPVISGGVTKSRSPKAKDPYTRAVERQSPSFPPPTALARYKQRERLIRVRIEREYEDDIIKYMHGMEEYTIPTLECMDQQPEIEWSMRICLLDFLIELHRCCRLRPETLYLAINIMDRYASRRVVFVKHYQLIGCSALWIAAKYEDSKDCLPSSIDLASFCDDTYQSKAFAEMELHILETIGWSLGHPTAEAWLRHLCEDTELVLIQDMAKFLMETTLYYREFVPYLSSAIAAGALCLARFIVGKGRCRIFIDNDEREAECLEVVERLDDFLAERIDELSELLVRKYSYCFHSSASIRVITYYLQGGRFTRQPLIPLPETPVRRESKKFSNLPIPLPATPSTSSTASDASDSMPSTPITVGELSQETFGGKYQEDISDEKENYPTAWQVPSSVADAAAIPYVPDNFLAVKSVLSQIAANRMEMDVLA